MVDVVGSKALREYRLWLRFDEGSEGVRDLSDLLDTAGPMVEPLRRAEYFRRVAVRNGAPTWPNGFDLDPINLYLELTDSGLLIHIPKKLRTRNMPEPPNDVLISEVAGPGRWGQFSATFDIVRSFFETEPTEPYEIRLRHVTSTGTLEGPERPVVLYKRSRNWAFEIRAAGDLAYPGKGRRPIVTFLRSGPGTFLYHLLMPGDANHDLMDKYLSKNFSGPSNRLRRVMLSAAELKSVWPDSPLWSHWP
jgi:Protein of unknown function (DUF2442)